MKSESETRQRLLACAKEEFMEKGYMASSLRSICKKAEVTTGALYFFFKDKADLFAAIVKEPVDKLYEVMLSHYKEESELNTEAITDWIDSEKDQQTALQVVRYLYRYSDEFQLVLTKSQGSGYEGIVDRFVEITEKHYRAVADRFCRQWQRPLLDDYIMHWMAHMHIDTFIHMITHEKSVDAACRYMEQTVRYFVSGFFGMIRNQGSCQQEAPEVK